MGFVNMSSCKLGDCKVGVVCVWFYKLVVYFCHCKHDSFKLESFTNGLLCKWVSPLSAAVTRNCDCSISVASLVQHD